MFAALAPGDLHELFVGAATNALWSLFSYAGQKCVTAIRGSASSRAPLASIYQQATQILANEYPDQNEQDRSRIRQFLASPELQAIARQYFSTKLLKDPEGFDPSSIRTEFNKLLSIFLDLTALQTAPLSAALLPLLVQECDNLLTIAIENGALSAHEAKSSVRHHQLMGELEAIKNNLLLLDSLRHSHLTSIHEFDVKYRNQVRERHKTIQPPNVDTVRRVPIDELFVTPMLISHSRKKEQQARPIGFSDFRTLIHRTIVLGNPGGGKSTLAQKLTYDLASQTADRALPGRNVTPILVILREYGGTKTAEGLSLLQFIERQAQSRYQISPPEGAFEYLFLNGMSFVIFDGLDELLETQYRQEISADVESFCNLYPAVPALVTSREVGYDQAPLDETVFNLYAIAPFSDEQVGSYAHKWFARDEDLRPEQKRQKAEAFLSESSHAPDLRSNPLMLSLMCNLYRVEGYIPRNRPDVYEKCSVMLFERWDKSRGIPAQSNLLPFESHIRPAMEHLAYWIYSNNAHQAGVTETLLASQTSTYLYKWVFDDQFKADSAAKAFIEFCTGRAWVFTDTGTTNDGERLFQFTHRTFLEYFSAMHLCYTCGSPAELSAMLQPRIARREWDVVAQLAFQIQSKRTQGAGDMLLESLLSSVNLDLPLPRWYLVTFAMKCLQAVVPSPKVRRSVSIACAEAFIDLSIGDSRPSVPETAGLVEIYELLRQVNAENRSIVIAVYLDVLTGVANGSDVERCLIALEAALTFTNQFVDRAPEGWLEEGRKLINGLKPRLLLFARSDFDLAGQCYFGGLIEIEDILDWHGPDVLFRSVKFRAVTWFYPPASRLYFNLITGSEVGSMIKLSDLSIIGRYLVGRPTPWLKMSEPQAIGLLRLEDCMDSVVHGNIDDTPIQALDSAGKFGAFAILAAIFEASGRESRVRFLNILAKSKRPLMEKFYRILQKRMLPNILPVPSLGLGNIEDAFVTSWVNKETNLVQPTSRSDGDSRSTVAAKRGPQSESDD